MYKIEVDSKPWTIRELIDMYRSGVLSMDIPIQRGVVWNNNARSLYVHSVLLGILGVQPPFVFSRKVSHREDDSAVFSYSVLDGKQRLTTLIAFVDEEFKLTHLDDQPSIEGCDLTGLKYSDLSEELIQQYLNTPITCTVVTDPTAEQEDVIFSRLNNNKSMSPVDKIRPQCKATSALIDFISNHTEFFSHMFTKKQLARKPEFEIVLKTLMMLDGVQGLSSKQMMEYAKDMPEDYDLAALDQVCSRANSLYERISSEDAGIPSFLKYKAVYLALVPYLNNDDIEDDTLAECIKKLVTERLPEFRTGSAHSPNAATIEERKEIIDSCL